MLNIEKVKRFLKLLDDEYELTSSWYGNGCEHGFKPSRECLNEDCGNRNLQRLWDEIHKEKKKMINDTMRKIIKRSLIKLAKEHKDSCKNPECDVMLSSLKTVCNELNIKLDNVEMCVFF